MLVLALHIEQKEQLVQAVDLHVQILLHQPGNLGGDGRLLGQLLLHHPEQGPDLVPVGLHPLGYDMVRPELDVQAPGQEIAVLFGEIDPIGLPHSLKYLVDHLLVAGDLVVDQLLPVDQIIIVIL